MTEKRRERLDKEHWDGGRGARSSGVLGAGTDFWGRVWEQLLAYPLWVRTAGKHILLELCSVLQSTTQPEALFFFLFLFSSWTNMKLNPSFDMMSLWTQTGVSDLSNRDSSCKFAAPYSSSDSSTIRNMQFHTMCEKYCGFYARQIEQK